MTSKKMKTNLEYLQKNKKKLLKDYPHKYIVIHNQKVVEAFDSYADAANYAIAQFGTKSGFLVHQMVEEEPLNFVFAACL